MARRHFDQFTPFAVNQDQYDDARMSDQRFADTVGIDVTGDFWLWSRHGDYRSSYIAWVL
jgi:hypothetical protein